MLLLDTGAMPLPEESRTSVAPVPPAPITVDAPEAIARPLLTQSWLDLTFLHWAVDPVDVAGLLPAGTVPDTLGGVTAGDRCLVVGAGAQGLLVCRILARLGIRPVVTEPHPLRLARAERLGAVRDDGRTGFTYVFETSGHASALRPATRPRCVRPWTGPRRAPLSS